MKRSRLRPVGARKKRELLELQRFREEVFRKAGFQCERCGETRDLHAHHRIPKGRGGSNRPLNGACLCWGCHREVHDHTVDDWRDWLG